MSENSFTSKPGSMNVVHQPNSGVPRPRFDPKDIDLQLNAQISHQLKNVIGSLRLTAAILRAVTFHPGFDDEKTVNETVRSILVKSSQVANNLVALTGYKPEEPAYIICRNLLRQQAAEMVSMQWQYAHTLGTDHQIEIDRLMECLDRITSIETPEVITNSFNHELSPMAERNLALVAVMPDIYAAVNQFNFFTKDSNELALNGLKEVIHAADWAGNALCSELADEESHTLSMLLIEKCGSLYEANYRAVSRKTVSALKQMDDFERSRLLSEHPDGLSTAEVNDSFHVLMERMVSMIAESEPSLRARKDTHYAPD